jgi:hypothetical protein
MQTRHHSYQSAVLILCAMKNNLSVLEIINGAKVKIFGAEGSGLEAIGSDRGGPLYMTGRDIGLLLDITIQRSSSSCQGNGSSLLINSASVGQKKSLKSPMSRKLAGTLKGDGGMNPLIPASLNGCSPIG